MIGVHGWDSDDAVVAKMMVMVMVRVFVVMLVVETQW